MPGNHCSRRRTCPRYTRLATMCRTVEYPRPTSPSISSRLAPAARSSKIRRTIGASSPGTSFASRDHVSGRCPVQPPARLRRLAHAHVHVLDDVLPVELREDPVDADLHPPRRSGEIDLTLINRVDADAVPGESPDQLVQVAHVSREPIEAPHHEIGDEIVIDKRKERRMPGRSRFFPENPSSLISSRAPTPCSRA